MHEGRDATKQKSPDATDLAVVHSQVLTILPPHSAERIVMNMGSKAVLFVAAGARTRARLEPLLQAAGVVVTDVSSAAEARHALHMLAFPIVVIERTLDDADGIELCNEIRRRETESRAYILLFSERDSEDDIAKGLAAGADDYLNTRSSDAELSDQLRRAAQLASYNA